MEEYDTFELDEQDLVLAQEAARQQFNKTEVRPNMYSFDWSDAHGALWDRVKQKIITRFGTRGARLDRVKTKAVSVAGGGGIRAMNGSITIAIPTQEAGFETEILIQALQPRWVPRKPWRHNLCYALLQPGTVIGTQKDELHVMAQPRPSLSPSRFSNDDFRRFKRADTHAFKEREITTNDIPLIQGTITDSNTRSTGPYDRAFQQNLIDHNIFPDGYEYPNGALPPEPENMNDILHAMAQPRPSLSPSRFSNDDFRRFKRADTHAFKEREITTNDIPLIQGTITDSKCVAGDVPFTNLYDLVYLLPIRIE
ncbi:hypothetical protein MAC_03266 [Metarhizium acridum CQMa 102]|uniref:Uncharacterized protein n=1 Tax=Metarhizium acridum (strain CQMa 102) TaxID=655827 RepID=E9E085_METAQ|nr:uncharacterized protein MAC_03266 [Metarhizium acridum CQMa 102]EFY90686.1 hypothetical protein MAC_03266 [Metarhizium acridum CQMa 102]